MLEIGSLVDGKYKILNKVGQGGMSVVYLAMNEKANKQWAVKEVRKDGIKDFEVVKQIIQFGTSIVRYTSLQLTQCNHPYPIYITTNLDYCAITSNIPFAFSLVAVDAALSVNQREMVSRFVCFIGKIEDDSFAFFDRREQQKLRIIHDN